MISVSSVQEYHTRNQMIRIRFANENDLEALIKIEALCFPKEEAASADDIRARFSAFKENFIVAYDDTSDITVGFINGSCYHLPELPDELYHDVSLHNANHSYQTVFGLNVIPEYRRQAIAKQLVEEMIAVAKQRNKKGVVLTCKDHLIHFYESFGFKCKGVSKSNHGNASWNDMLLLF